VQVVNFLIEHLPPASRKYEVHHTNFSKEIFPD